MLHTSRGVLRRQAARAACVALAVLACVFPARAFVCDTLFQLKDDAHFSPLDACAADAACVRAYGLDATARNGTVFAAMLRRHDGFDVHAATYVYDLACGGEHELDDEYVASAIAVHAWTLAATLAERTAQDGACAPGLERPVLRADGTVACVCRPDRVCEAAAPPTGWLVVLLVALTGLAVATLVVKVIAIHKDAQPVKKTS